MKKRLLNFQIASLLAAGLVLSGVPVHASGKDKAKPVSGQTTGSSQNKVTAIRTWIGSTSSTWTDASNWSGGAVPSPGENIVINASGNNPIMPGSDYASITVNSGATLTLAGDSEVGTVTFVGSNAIIDTGGKTLMLITSITGETNESHVNGNLAFVENVNAKNTYTFGNIGVVFNNTTTANWGFVTVTRTTGTAVSNPDDNSKKGIMRTWNIVPDINANANVNLTLKWLGSEDNGNTFATTNAQVWKQVGSNPWQRVGTAIGATISGDDRSMTVATTSFSKWTVASTSNPLPVSWLRFNGALTETGTKLTWATATEKNTAAFVVERSADGKTYDEIGAVKAAGNSNQELAYSFTDQASIPAKTYYRLRQTDIDGAVSYSKIITIYKNSNHILEATAYPNPFGQNLNLRVTAPEAVKQVVLVALDGKEVYRKAINAETDLNLENMPALKPGMYLLQLIGETGITTLKVSHQ